MRREVLVEALHGVRVAPRRGEEQPAPVEIDEQRDVLVPRRLAVSSRPIRRARWSRRRRRASVTC
jgi:hypothetical protein